MANKINFSDYTASGVYFMEIDNSVINTTSTRTALRMAVGFNMRGPFNRPVYIAGTDDCDKFFGPIDRKLERYGCFTNRMVRTLARKAPVYALNLLNVVEGKDANGVAKDGVGCNFLPLCADSSNYGFTAAYSDMYDKTKFWVADDEAFVNNAFLDGAKGIIEGLKDKKVAPFYAVGNCGTKDISVLVKKSENVSGYNVTFLDYYGSKDNIPYKWINPYDYVSDYFIDVILVSGKWNDAITLSQDVVWSKYFSADGLKPNMLDKFLRLDAVNVIKQWTGCLIPNFQDKQGNTKSIDYLVNSKCNETGLMFGVNEDAMDFLALDGSTYFYDVDGTGVYEEDNEFGDSFGTDFDSIADVKFKPDFTGYTIDASTTTASFMSAKIDLQGMVENIDIVTSGVSVGANEFAVQGNDNINKVSVGDYVKSTTGHLAKITKKKIVATSDDAKYAIFTASTTVNKESGKVEYHKSIPSATKAYAFMDLAGLKLSTRHIPGYAVDDNGMVTFDCEGGVEKIYKMLENSGIRKGLLNDDAIDFRYIVDTMAYGLKENCGGKKYLSDLAKEKGHCTAIINAPSMSQFASSNAPYFGAEADKSCFDVAYIPQGGNPDMAYSADTEYFSLPDEDHGATHVGVFAPFLKYTERNRTILVPPAADVANTFMNKFTGGDPYATVANLNGILNNMSIAGVEYQFDETDRGHLETMGINPIIERNGQITIYGDKTAYQTVNSDLSYLHVREILNTIQIACKAVLDDYVFTYNIPTTRAEIVTRINPILKSMKDSGALVRYEIQCDDVNNDKEVIDNKFCIVDIGVWISQNMEKIVVPITINRSTTA